MSGRRNTPNESEPAWMVVLMDEVPACFTDQTWALFLSGVRDEAMGDKAMRRRLERGWLPRYCADCTPEHRAAMALLGKCEPLDGYA